MPRRGQSILSTKGRREAQAEAPEIEATMSAASTSIYRALAKEQRQGQEAFTSPNPGKVAREPMKSIAIYARVSSEQQAQQATIESQVAALEERVAADGHVILAQDIYLDDGFSGSTLVRPALERLRDRVAEGAIDRLYVHSPDRLARKYAWQVLLLDELRKHGVTVVFLNAPAGTTAEDELLVQVQGMIAEYERAKILERSRRGKIHRARQGEVGPLGTAPYGFAYVKKRDGAPAAEIASS